MTCTQAGLDFRRVKVREGATAQTAGYARRWTTAATSLTPAAAWRAPAALSGPGERSVPTAPPRTRRTGTRD